MSNVIEVGFSGFINAGGRGTRLESVFAPDEKTGVAKALIPIESMGGMRMIDYHIALMLGNGIKNIVVSAGDHELVAKHVQAGWYESGDVTVVTTTKQHGTGGDMIKAVRAVETNPDLLVVNVDTILDIDEQAMVRRHRTVDADATIALTSLRGVANQDAYHTDISGRVVYSAESDPRLTDVPPAIKSGSSTGCVAIRRHAVTDYDWEPERGELSIYRHIIGRMIERCTMYSFDNGYRYFLDIGTPEGYKQFEDQQHLLSGLNPPDNVSEEINDTMEVA